MLRAQHALFDRLVYRKLRAALGGNCHASVSGGAPLGARLGHFYRGVGLTIYEGYGLTETSAAITVNQIGALKIGTVGKLVPGNSMRIADDGELLVRGGVVFSGYWRNEQATDEAFADGWFSTGDLGAVDDDGFLTITGRKKEIIVTAGGKNVAPAVLEDQLRAHPLISQAMVVGDNKPFIGALITIDPEAFDGWKQPATARRPTRRWAIWLPTPTWSPRWRRPSSRPTWRCRMPSRSASSAFCRSTSPRTPVS